MPLSPPVEGLDLVEGDAPTKAKSAPKKTGKVKGHTIYLPDDLFERIMVAAHRRDKTISEYVAAILERQVPDHRVRVEPVAEIRPESTESLDRAG